MLGKILLILPLQHLRPSQVQTILLTYGRHQLLQLYMACWPLLPEGKVCHKRGADHPISAKGDLKPHTTN